MLVPIPLEDLLLLIRRYLDTNPLLVPLGIVGFWRWTVWTIKQIIALFYHPQTAPFFSPVSIVTPVYNEDPKIFSLALESWAREKPEEIIAVIDYTDKNCLEIFQAFSQSHPEAKLIVTREPGKRGALALGIKRAKSPIVALVDSDTLWEVGVIRNTLPPFHDIKIAGVGTYQNVLDPKTLAQKIFDIQLDLRYAHEFPFLARAGDALVCLSGRTAFYRRSAILPLLPDLVNETFLGEKVVSGDDKRLTYLVLARGWKVTFQANAHVFTPGMPSLGAYFKQRLRWSRNALRADIRALWEGWPWRHPALIFFQLDKIAQSFVVLLSPIYFFTSLFLGSYISALVIFLWWFASRTVKMAPHLFRRPGDIIILPAFIAYTFLSAPLKVYAFFTLNTQGWITRWDKARLPQLRFIQSVPAYAATVAVILVFGLAVLWLKQQNYILPRAQQAKLIATVLPQAAAAYELPEALPAKVFDRPDLAAIRHVVLPGESLVAIANNNEISVNDLLAANQARIINWSRLSTGEILTIPGKDISLAPSFNFNYQRLYPDILQITYDRPTNTIFVSGRGQRLKLTDIRSALGDSYLTETSPKEWYLTANLFLRSGITFDLNHSEVSWLKLASNRSGHVSLRALNAIITVNGVRITSWDQDNHTYDTNINDGRSFILVKDGSRLDIYNSELAYLGYPRTPDLDVSPYGVSWRMSNGKMGTTVLTGEVIGSQFHHNYFGAYTFGATGMVWRGNKFFDNIQYGLDPHDDSNGFLVEDNLVFNNGSHGIIFSKRCQYNIIRNNYSYNNGIHGIMLHEQSNFNLVEGNILTGNAADGIALWGSNRNIIRDNIIKNNNQGVRASANSFANLIEGNRIDSQKILGIYFYSDSGENIVRDNSISQNPVGIYLKTDSNQILANRLDRNRIGVYLFAKASNNLLADNNISRSHLYAFYSKVSPGTSNLLGNNTLSLNLRDVFAR